MGRPGKLKSGSGNKLKKWSRGNACVSNPTSTKFRDKARSTFFHMQPTLKSNKGLTEEALKMHDEMQDETDHGLTAVDKTSEGGDTFGTFLSGLSDCSNITFQKIQKYWLNHSAKHKEVCAVLAAITEVIREHGGQESDTAYFAALVTALSSVEQVESAAAIAYLLAMTVVNVPVAVLQAKFAEVSKMLFEMLGQFSANKGSDTPTALVRSILSTLAVILRRQEIIIWNDSSTMNIYQAILSYTVHSKPKIRKAAQNAVCSVLCGSDFITASGSTMTSHPAAAVTAKFCAVRLEKLGGIAPGASTCHILALLGRIFHTFPKLALKQSCETVLRLMTLSDSVVKGVCLSSLQDIFAGQCHPDILPPDLNAQIITALYDYYPNASDVQGCPPWLAVMEKALLNLCRSYMDSTVEGEAVHLALVHIPKLFITCFKLLLSPSPVVAKASASTITAVLKGGASAFWSKEDISIDKADEVKFVTLIFKTAEDGLKYKYHTVWDLVFQIIEATFKCFVNQTHFATVKPLLESIVNLRNTQQFQFRTELDSAVGSAIAKLGPAMFFQAVPLQIDGTDTDYDFPRSWLIPLFKKHLRRVELSFFSDYFLPLAAKLRIRSEELKHVNRDLEASTYETLHMQCWDLLPVFCKEAVDISTAFPKVAKIMGRALDEKKDLQPIVMASLRHVLSSAKKLESDLKVVSRYSKNFLPILFNLYTNTENTSGIQLDDNNELSDANKKKSLERLAALETIRLYLTVTDKELICIYFDKAQEKVFKTNEEKTATRLALLDLLIAMVSYVNSDQIETIYSAMKPMLNSINPSLQKKAYRILQVICSSDNSSCSMFVRSHLEELQTLLVSGLLKASPSSKGPRIKCMEQIYLQLQAKPETENQSNDYLKIILPEVILCTKEAKRSRIAAFDLLVTTAKAYCTSCDNEREKPQIVSDKIDEYFSLVFVGLAGSPMMIKSTILALSRLVYDFKDHMSHSLLDQTITNVCLLLGCNTREIIEAALGFVMVLLHILPKEQLGQYIKSIVDALVSWKDSTRRHFRFKVKNILRRLVQKFDFETIYSMTPEVHRKQLGHIKKQTARKKRLAAERKILAGDDAEEELRRPKKETMEEILADSSDSDDEPASRSAKQKKTKKGTWLQESQDEPLDLLDPSVSQKVLMTNPKAKSGKEKTEFKTAVDGRLIIMDENEDADGDDNVKILKSIGVGKDVPEVEKPVTKKRKLDDIDDDDNFVDENSKMYKPGGKGIHRQITPDETGVKYKAKKAGGDVKRKGAHDPYAYLPFNTGMLNRRKRKKLSGQYEGLIKAAKKGAAKGKKAQTRSKKK